MEGVLGLGSGSNIPDRASGLVFLEPGQYEGEVESVEEKHPPGLPGDEALSCSEVF